jgi:hypothetical protein
LFNRSFVVLVAFIFDSFLFSAACGEPRWMRTGCRFAADGRLHAPGAATLGELGHDADRDGTRCGRTDRFDSGAAREVVEVSGLQAEEGLTMQRQALHFLFHARSPSYL